MRLDAGASDSERKHICSWVEEAPEHAVAFARAMAAWNTSGLLKSANDPALGDREIQHAEMRKFILGLE